MEISQILNSSEARIGSVCAAFVLYLLVFFSIGPEVVELWPEIIIVFLSILVATLLARRYSGMEALFFALIAMALLGDLINVLLLQLDPPPTNNGSSSEDVFHNSSYFYGIHLFLWNCAWTMLVIRMAHYVREGRTFFFVIPLLIVGTIAILGYQLDNYNFRFQYMEQRFYFAFLVLSLTGVQFGLVGILMGVSRGMQMLVIGFTLESGSSILSVFSPSSFLSAELSLAGIEFLTNNYLDPFWALSKLVILIGLLMLIATGTANVGRKTAKNRLFEKDRKRSGLSVYLLVFWLFTVATAMIAIHTLNDQPHLLAMFIVLFSAACIMVMAAITLSFDDVVAYLEDWVEGLFNNELQESGRGHTKLRIRRWLGVSALDSVLDTIKEAAGSTRENVIFLGPERLNRPETTSESNGRTSCFLVMPFNTEWSDTVTESLRKVCKKMNIHALRGDDIFRPTDILDDIWNGITSTDFVIAEITGKNANVFYELGMAHAIGKPVLILAQNAEEIPFDLKTRRILEYSPNSLEVMEKELEDCLIELLKYYKFTSSDDK